MENFDWEITWKPSEILYSMLKSLQEDDQRTDSQVHALAFAIGQVVALEATSTLKLQGKEYSPANIRSSQAKAKKN